MSLSDIVVDSLIDIPKQINTKLRPVLADSSIKKMNSRNLLIEGYLKIQNLNPNSVNLTLGNRWKREIPNRTEDGLIDPNLPPAYEEGNFTAPTDILDPRRNRNSWEPAHYTEEEHFILDAKSYVLINSEEIINVPLGYVAYISPILEKIQSGILVTTENFIEAGFRGPVSFSIYNQNRFSIVLLRKMIIAKVLFLKAELCSFMKGK